MATTLEEVATLLQEFKSREAEAELRIKEQEKKLCCIGTTLYNLLDLVDEGYKKLREEGRDAKDAVGYRLRCELHTLDEQVAALWK